MCFKGSLNFPFLILVFLLCGSSSYAENSSEAEDNFVTELQNKTVEDISTATLRLEPARCIALHRGQTCYQRTKILWKLSAISDVCVFDEESEKPIQCWEAANQGILKIDFQSSSDKVYFLKSGKKVIASTEMRVAWVYNRGGKRVAKKQSWRMF